MTTRRMPLMDISNTDTTSSQVDAGNRRKSGRAKRVPEKFVPDAPSSQAGANNSKRKRGGEDAENDASEIEEDDEISDATVESAAEEELRDSRRRQKQKKTKKPAAKKPKVNGTTNSEEAPTVQLPNRSKKGSRKVAIADQDVDGLYAEVFSSRKPLEDVATAWLDRFEADRTGAMREMVNFALRSAGCKLEVSNDDIDDPENCDGRLSDLQDAYQAQNITDYPLISKAKGTHNFRAALMGFFDKLIEVMHAKKILYDEVPLMQNMEAWFVPMSSSSLRPFRHTSTLICLAITSALCRVAHGEIEISAKVQRQLESEKKNKRPNAGRVAEFQKRVDTNEDHKKYIEKDLLKGYFDSVYVHRYRDVDPRIRTECVEALGDWILTYPSHFFEGSYLRYIGWMLSDVHGPLRQEAVKQLQKFMNVLDTGGLRSFIERFRERLVEMATRDSEPGVRASTIELLDMIREAQMLAPDDIDAIGKLIFDSEPRVRKAVVDFFAATIEDLFDSRVEEVGGEEALEDAIGVEDDDDYDHPRTSWIRYKCLAESLVAYDIEDADEMPSQIDAADTLNVAGIESRFTLAAHALYDKISELKDWEVLAGYLLFDHTSKAKGNETERALREAFKPTEKEELVLLEALNAIVKLSLAQADESEKGNRTKQAKADQQEAKETAARHLAGLIPRLLKKYGADPRTATVVLRLEHVLNLDVFQELRQDSTVYAQLLDEISAQFNSHGDKGVLAEVGAALLHARKNEQLEEVTEGKMQTLWDDVTTRLQKISKAGDISVRGTLRTKVLLELSHNLARLEQLSSISSPVDSLETDSGKGQPLPINILLDVIARGVYEDSNDEALDALEDQTVLSAMRSAMFYFMWKIRAVSQTVEAGDEIPDIEIDQLREWQEAFDTNLIASFSSRSTLDAVRLLGAGTLLDLHVLFSNQLRSVNKSKSKTSQGNAYLQTLVKEIAPEVQQELTSVLDLLEKEFAKRSKKKLAEPGDDEDPEDPDSEPEDDEDEDDTSDEHQAKILRAEKQLCELAGKLVLGIIAQVIDVSGPLKGKLRSRLQRNKQRLGPNYKEVVAYLDEPKLKSKKSHKGKAQQEAAVKKSAETVVDDDEDDDPFAEEEPEEDSVEDLRRRESIDEEPEGSVEENGEANGADGNDDDEIMGD